eukprot:13483475-Alexandrium_andersonii.AAC.1
MYPKLREHGDMCLSCCVSNSELQHALPEDAGKQARVLRPDLEVVPIEHDGPVRALACVAIDGGLHEPALLQVAQQLVPRARLGI